MKALSAKAKFIPKGHTIPPEGAYKTATTSADKLGSIDLASSPDNIFSPSTPFSFPCSYNFLRLSISPISKHRTIEPF